MSVISGTFASSMGFFCMTVICGCFLSAEVALHFPSAHLRREGDTVHPVALYYPVTSVTAITARIAAEPRIKCRLLRACEQGRQSIEGYRA
jgi:hypothetical protein